MQFGKINSKRIGSLMLATVIAGGSSSLFSGCQEHKPNSYIYEQSKSVGRQVIHFENEQDLYDSIVSIRNKLYNFISNPDWQMQVVVTMSDDAEAALKVIIVNTIELFDEFISSWENNDSEECTKKAQEIMKAYLDESDSPKYLSFNYFYKFISERSFPKGFTDVPKEVKMDEPFATFHAGKDTKIYYLGRKDTLIHNRIKISWDYIGDIDFILPFYKNITVNLTNTLLYVVSEDGITLGVIKKDDLNAIIQNYLLRIKELNQMDPYLTTIYQISDAKWGFFVDDEFVKEVPSIYYVDLSHINYIYESIENKKGSPFKIRMMLSDLSKLELLENQNNNTLRKS